jgi:hypothetical protein
MKRFFPLLIFFSITFSPLSCFAQISKSTARRIRVAASVPSSCTGNEVVLVAGVGYVCNATTPTGAGVFTPRAVVDGDASSRSALATSAETGASAAHVVDLLARRVLRLRVESNTAIDFAGDLEGAPAAPLPTPSTAHPGRILRVTDETGAKTIHVDTGAGGWQALTSPLIYAEWFGISGDGVSDNDKLFDNAITAVAGTGYILQLGAGDYGLVNKVGGTNNNVKIRGLSPEQTSIKKLAGSPERFLFNNAAHANWEISDLTIDGNGVGGNGQTLAFSNSRNIILTNVHFRNAMTGISNTVGFKCVRCAFWGTRAGEMAAGTDRPTPNPNAAYRNGFTIASSVHDTTFEDCIFHFNNYALQAAQSATDRSRGLRVLRNKFRGDWWNQPYVITAFTAANFSPGGGAGGSAIGGGILTFNEAGAVPLTANQSNAMALTVEIGSGASFTRPGGSRGDVLTLDAGVTGVKKGDSFETADGRRAEVMHAPNSMTLVLAPWESMDTFEQIAFPTNTKVSWKIRRYYGAFMHPAHKPRAGATSIELYSEFYNPHDGERFSDTKLPIAGREVRMFASATYRGIHLSSSAGYDDVEINGNVFRGSWADQVSLFGARRARITNNFITLGGDEGITLTRSHDAVVANNIFHSQGASFIYAASNYVSVTGNQGTGWSGVNPLVGAIDIAGRNSTFTSNVFHRAAFPKANTAFLIRGTSDNTVIAANTDDAIRHTILMQLGNRETAYNLRVRDARNIVQSVYATNSDYSINPGAMVSDAETVDNTGTRRAASHIGTDGRFSFRAGTKVPPDSGIDNGKCSPYLDETARKLKLRCRTSDGGYLDFELTALP